MVTHGCYLDWIITWPTLCDSRSVIFHFLLISNSTFSTDMSSICPKNTDLERIMTLAIGQSCHLYFILSLSNSGFLHALLVILARACGWGCLMLDIIISHLNSPDVVSLLRAETEPKSTLLLLQDAPFLTTEIKTWADWPGVRPKHNHFFITHSFINSSVLLCRLKWHSVSGPKSWKYGINRGQSL